MQMTITGGLSREWSSYRVVWQFLGVERDEREVKHPIPKKSG